MNQVIPINDLLPHGPTAECWCFPTVVRQPGSNPVLVHNAKDCREARERASGGKPCSDGYDIVRPEDIFVL